METSNEVVASKNLGEHVCTIFSEQKLKEAIEFYVYRGDISNTPEGKKHLQLIPTSTLEEFHLGLHAFDFSDKGKNGCQGLSKLVAFFNINYRLCLWLSLVFN